MATNNDTAEDFVWLGKRLKEARLRHKMKAGQVARQLGIAPNTVTAWEQGRNRELTEPAVAMAQLYGWPEGAIDRVLAGGFPFPDTAADVPEPVPTTLDLNAREEAEFESFIEQARSLKPRQRRKLLADLLGLPSTE